MLVLVLMVAIAAVGASGTLVSADPCIAQLSYPIMPTAYSYNSNVQVIVPVSATCTSIGTAFTAVGDAYDTSGNADLGSVNTLLSPVNGATFSGQLVFNLPPTSLGHTVQVSVSIYNGGQTAPGQYGTLLTTASETVQVNPTNYNGYSQYSNTPYNNYPPSQYYVQPQQITTVTAYVPQIVQQPISPGRQVINGTLMQQPYSRALYQGQQNTTWLMVVVAIVIAFSVVVAVVFAVIATRNRQQQQYWPPSIQNQR
jgi:hypothetical protein